MAQADCAHSTRAPAPSRKPNRSYLTPMGYTERRPASFPALDRRAVMLEAHRIAKRSGHITPSTAKRSCIG
jgi:hypothetical protein